MVSVPSKFAQYAELIATFVVWQENLRSNLKLDPLDVSLVSLLVDYP